MHQNTIHKRISWICARTLKTSAINTFWCLLGCSIGDYATILYFQIFKPDVSMWIIMLVAMSAGILTSIALETWILARQQMELKLAFYSAMGMSLISMLMMESAANLVDFLLAGRAMLIWWTILPSLLAGFLSAWPYNYYRLKKFGKACH